MVLTKRVQEETEAYSYVQSGKTRSCTGPFADPLRAKKRPAIDPIFPKSLANLRSLALPNSCHSASGHLSSKYFYCITEGKLSPLAVGEY